MQELPTSDGKPVFTFDGSNIKIVGGERVIGGYTSSPAFEEVLADIQRRFADLIAKGIPVIPFIILQWADGTALTPKISAHPVIMMCVNIHDDFVDQHINVIRMGVCAPTLTVRHFEKKHVAALSDLNLFAYHLCQDLIWEDFWHYNRVGIPHPSVLLPDGSGSYSKQQAIFVPYMEAVPVDMSEAWTQTCHRQNGTFAHISLLVPTFQLANPNVRVRISFFVVNSYDMVMTKFQRIYILSLYYVSVITVL